ncbi:MAG: hypothetical protein KJ048_12175 [Dehalococcoidia bacterium]|nr:hypothetical protein [Dehalococcoidia bacterium]
MARTPMSLRNDATYIDKIIPFGPLEQATAALGQRLQFMDSDMLREKRGRVLMVEWKTPGAVISGGQGYTFDGLTRTGLHTVVIAWGDAGMPTAYQIWGQMAAPEPCDLAELAALFVSWDRWAQVQPLPAAAPPEWQPLVTGKTA